MVDLIRLVFCHTCHSVQEIPDYEGDIDHDYYLRLVTDAHQFADGRPHRGLMAKCEDDPAKINAAIDELENTVNPGQGVGLGQQLYDLKDNYKIEAMQCWKRHNRTRDCDDYRSDAKRLWLDDRAERRAEGMTLNKEERPNIWLCDHCVVHSLVQQRQRDAAGLYD